MENTIFPFINYLVKYPETLSDSPLSLPAIDISQEFASANFPKEAKLLLPPTNDWVIPPDISSYLNTPAGTHKLLLCRSPQQLHSLILGIHLKMTVDDPKGMKDQLDQKPNGKTAKGTTGG